MLFSGIYPALVTPYTNDGKLDYDELTKLVHYLSNQGVSGFYICGSTAEAFLLSHEERKKIVETVVKANEKKLKVIVHVGDIGTGLSLDLARHAEKCGVDAISSVAPFYFKFSEDEIFSYYKDLSDNIDLPLVLYNFPANSGVTLSLVFFNRLAELKNVKALKHTSSDFYLMERIKYSHPDISVFNGYDEMLLSGLIAGADGAIDSTFNCIAPIDVKLLEYFKNGDLAKASYLQHRANDLIQLIIKGGVNQSIKAILEYQGFKMNGCRRPFGEIMQDDKNKLIKAYIDIKNEFAF